MNLQNYFNTGVDMADRFIKELEEAFSGMDEDLMFALAGGVLATALDGLAIKHGEDPAKLRSQILEAGAAADEAAQGFWKN